MVHALHEIQRILKPKGMLIDLRPVEDNWSVEVSASSGYQVTGRVNDLPIGLEDDEAAFRAMREVEARGWFIRKKEDVFSFFYYFDTPSEMKGFMDEEWEDFVKVDEAAWQKTRSVWASSNADARVRIRVKMHIALWERGRVSLL